MNSTETEMAHHPICLNNVLSSLCFSISFCRTIFSFLLISPDIPLLMLVSDVFSAFLVISFVFWVISSLLTGGFPVSGLTGFSVSYSVFVIVVSSVVLSSSFDFSTCLDVVVSAICACLENPV